MKANLSLHQKVNAIIIITFTAIATAIVLIWMPLQQEHIQSDMNQFTMVMKTLVERDHDALASEIFDERYPAIQLRLQQMVTIQGIEQIMIYDNQGKWLAAVGKAPSMEPLSIQEKQLAQEGMRINQDVSGEEMLIFYQKIEVIGELVGFIRIDHSLKHVQEEFQEAVMLIIILLFMIFCIMLTFFNWMLFRIILSPIKYLQNTMKRMQSGEIGEQIQITTYDEIGELLQAYNQMSMELQIRQQQLETRSSELLEIKEKLEEKVEERTSNLLQTKNYLNNIINSMPSLLIGVDTEGKITEWNSKAEEVTGISTQKAEGEMLSHIFPPLSNHMKIIQQALLQKTPHKIEKIQNLLEQANTYYEMIIFPLIADNVEGAVIRIDDITMRIQLEEIMVQTEKMMSVGGLAAGMAHEINNPLSVIMQSLQNITRLISPKYPKNQETAQKYGIQLEQMEAYLQEKQILTLIKGMQETSVRAAKIIQDMLQFSRQSNSQKTPVDLVKLIDTTIQLASTDFDLQKNYDFRRIKIIRDFVPNLPKIFCVITEIQQVILNLLRNAAQAMYDPENLLENGPSIILRVQQEQGMIRIEVGDNGPGMEEKVRKRIFEPFFTTKPVGVGTGLGLSVSYFIITTNHRGQINVESRPGQGTTFIIHLPVR